MIDVLVISIANPLLIGIYQDKYLVKQYSKNGKTSDILPLLFDEILKVYNIKGYYYVNGPGSYMAIKVCYIFLKTLSIAQGKTLMATDGFVFNNNSAIKALGNKYFFKNTKTNQEIYLDTLQNNTIEPFRLPSLLDTDIFSDDILPKYCLPVIMPN